MNKYMNKKSDNQTIKVAISHGDFNGIGYEVIIKTFRNQAMLDLCTPIVYGSSKLASYHKKAIDDSRVHFNLVKSAGNAVNNRLNIVNVYFQEAKADLGVSTPLAGELSFISLERATEELMQGHADVLVTAPK